VKIENGQAGCARPCSPRPLRSRQHCVPIPRTVCLSILQEGAIKAIRQVPVSLETVSRIAREPCARPQVCPAINLSGMRPKRVLLSEHPDGNLVPFDPAPAEGVDDAVGHFLRDFHQREPVRHLDGAEDTGI
jgi:hypothetical protein